MLTYWECIKKIAELETELASLTIRNQRNREAESRGVLFHGGKARDESREAYLARTVPFLVKLYDANNFEGLPQPSAT